MFFQTTKPNSAPVFETSLHQSAGSDVSICCSLVNFSAGEGRARQRWNGWPFISRIGEPLAPCPGCPGGWAAPWRRCPGAPASPRWGGGRGGGWQGHPGEPALLCSHHPGLAGLLAGSHLKQVFFKNPLLEIYINSSAPIYKFLQLLLEPYGALYFTSPRDPSIPSHPIWTNPIHV